MSTSRPFAYNTGSPIDGTIQVGDLAVGYPTTGYTGTEWWNGPDEELGYVIAQPVSTDTQPTPIFSASPMTWSSTYKATDISLSDNNQSATQIFSYVQSVLSQTIINDGDKVIFTIKYTSTNPSVGIGQHFVGLGKTSMSYQGPFNGNPGNDDKSVGFSDDGKYYYNGNIVATGLPTWTTSDYIDIAVDLKTGNKVWIRVNGGNWNNSPSENPETGVCSLGIGGLTSIYPAVCPGIYGTMLILDNTLYSSLSGFYQLGTNVTGSVGFFRTDGFDDNEFIQLSNTLLNENYNNGYDASTGLTSNGYWNSYSTLTSPVLSLDAADYSGSGPWIDSIGGKSFTLNNSPTWSSSNGGYFNFNSSSSQYAICNTSLSSLSNWTVGVWHYYTGSETGSGPCIVTETFVGGGINYSIGKNNGPFSSGFFDGGWRTTDGYSLSTNNWYYIVGTYDGSTIKLYVNNILVDSTNYTGTPTSSGAGIRLMERWDLSDYWDGKLAIVDIYDTALNQTEITTIWNSTKTRFGFAGPLTVLTNDTGGLTGWGSGALSVAYDPTLISTYPVGSTITFQDSSTATIVGYDPYAPNYIDIFWDTPKTGTLFPITISY